MAAFRAIVQITKTFSKRFGSNNLEDERDTKVRRDEKRLTYIHVNQEKVLKINILTPKFHCTANEVENG